MSVDPRNSRQAYFQNKWQRLTAVALQRQIGTLPSCRPGVLRTQQYSASLGQEEGHHFYRNSLLSWNQGTHRCEHAGS